jgi:hypothetical protein
LYAANVSHQTPGNLWNTRIFFLGVFHELKIHGMGNVVLDAQLDQHDPWLQQPDAGVHANLTHPGCSIRLLTVEELPLR